MQISNKAKTPSALTLEASIINPLTQIGIKSMGNSISIIEKSQLTMSSREIAALTKKRHDNICRDIRAILVALLGGEDSDYIRNSELSYLTNQHVRCEQYDPKNPNAWEYHISRRYTEILITGYDIKRRTSVIDRLYELEKAEKSNIVALPNFNDPVEAARAWANEKEQAILLTHEVEELKPKAVFHDKVTSTNDAISLSQAAKTLGTGRNRLCSLLRQNKWLRRNNEPYQDKIEQGLLDVKLSNWEHPDNGLQQSVTALVTGKGLVKIQSLLQVH